MANQKISQLPSGTNAQAGDLFVIARGGANLALTTAQLFNAPSAAATFASLAVSGNLAVDTNTFFVDAVNNRVGVGTASPGRALDVAPNGIAVNSAGSVTSGFSDYLNGGAWDAIGASSAGSANILALGGYRSSQWQAVDIYTAGTSKLRVDASGNLGLGVTPSAWSASIFRTLQLGVGAGSVSLSGRSDTASDLVLGKNFYNVNGTFYYVAPGVATMYRCDGNQHELSTAPSGANAGDAITFTTRLRVDATTTAGQTALLLWDVDNNTLERVTVGAADSGGTGFKVLRIPN